MPSKCSACCDAESAECKELNGSGRKGRRSAPPNELMQTRKTCACIPTARWQRLRPQLAETASHDADELDSAAAFSLIDQAVSRRIANYIASALVACGLLVIICSLSTPDASRELLEALFSQDGDRPPQASSTELPGSHTLAPSGSTPHPDNSTVPHSLSRVSILMSAASLLSSPPLPSTNLSRAPGPHQALKSFTSPPPIRPTMSPPQVLQTLPPPLPKAPPPESPSPCPSSPPPRPLRPPQPAPTPPPPTAPARGSTVDELNARFLSPPWDFPHPGAGGVLLHQFDGWEDPQRPWAPCPRSGGGGICADTGTAMRRDRVSATLIFRELNSPSHARGVIGVYSFGGGVVLRPSSVSVNCAYGADGAIDYGEQNCRKGEGQCVPGCGVPPHFCSRDAPLVSSWCRCSFAWCDGRPRPWAPADVGFMLRQQADFGNEFSGFGTYTGYNEIVLDSDYWMAQLPRAIDAFFFVECGSWGNLPGITPASSQITTLSNEFLRSIRSCQAAEDYTRGVHALFEAEYGVGTAALLKLRLDRWDQPFTHT
eukprot:865869-Pleurochrysis_carterae.AAC.1